MNATIHKFPTKGDSSALPSLTEMFIAIRKNYHLLDEIDRDAYAFIAGTRMKGDMATIEAVEGSWAMAWSMLNRYGIAV
ncbi:MAG: hypothetical protein ACYC1K_03470 [Minisyncoccota bacterium]